MSDECYACESPATGWEHAPPKCLFPENKDLPKGVSMRRGRLIRVRSCSVHNTEKSDDDEYFRFVLAGNVMANSAGRLQSLTKVLRSFMRSPAVKARFLAHSWPTKIQERGKGKIHDVQAFPMEYPRFERSLALVAMGVYRDHFGKRYPGMAEVFADFVDQPLSATLQKLRASFFDAATLAFSQSERIGDNQEVFWYQVRELGGVVVMRLGFYGNSTATAVFP